MFNGQKINELLEKSDTKKNTLYVAIGLSKKGLDDIINGVHTPKATHVEAIADFFDISIDELFERNREIKEHNIGHHVLGNGNNVSGDITLSNCQKEIAHLKELLAERERTIQILMNKGK